MPRLPHDSYLFGLSFLNYVSDIWQGRVDSSNHWNGAHHGGHGYSGYGYAASQHQDVGDVGVHAAAAVNGVS